MAKRQGLFVFVDTRASTKRLYAEPDFFETFIKDTLDFIIRTFRNQLLTFGNCLFKPLGDGLLISYIPQEETLKGDEAFPTVLEAAVKASFACVTGYDSEMRGKSTRDTPASRRYRLGVSIASGFVYDFVYKDEPPVTDIASMALTYTFRLNKLADPEGVIVSDWLYENYKNIFDEIGGVFERKKKYIDTAFDIKPIYASKEVDIKDDKGDTTESYTRLGEHSISLCKDMIKAEIHKGHFSYKAPPDLRLLLFKCDDKQIEEVFNIYPGGGESAKKDIFKLLPKEKVEIEGKYPLLFFECYYKKEIVYFAYRNRYIRNKQKYIEETRERFYVQEEEDRIEEFFDQFALKPSSGLAIPIFDTQHEEVKWIVAIDSVETKVFNKRFYDQLGTAISTYFDTEIREKLELAESRPEESSAATTQ